MKFHNGPAPEIGDIVRGVIRANSLALLIGRRNSGKTHTAVDMACHVALGKPWHGHAIGTGRRSYSYDAATLEHGTHYIYPDELGPEDDRDHYLGVTLPDGSTALVREEDPDGNFLDVCAPGWDPHNRVLYIANEDHTGVLARRDAWDRRNRPSGLVVASDVNLTSEDSVSELLAHLARAGERGEGYQLVVVDTLMRSGVMNESGPDMAQAVESLVQLKDALNYPQSHCLPGSVLVLHHPAKGTNEPRGLGVLSDSSDQIFTLSGAVADRRGAELKRVRNKNGQDGLDDAYRLRLRVEDLALERVTAAPAEAPAVDTDPVEALILSLADRSRRAAVAALQDAGHSRPTAYRYASKYEHLLEEN